MKMKLDVRSRRISQICLLGFCAVVLFATSNLHAQNVSGSGYIRQANNDSVIVFVHGVLGDSRSTWTNVSTKAYWPSLMKNDPYFNRFDIFVVDYPSDFLQSDYTVDELVEVMRRDLESAEIFAKHKYVYFLCHSMGGLVVRGYLTRYQKNARQVPMIYFFSTPTTGAEIANLARLVARNREMSGLSPVNVNEYLASVQKGWLAAQFQIASYCAYETQDTYGVRIVDEGSATNLCNRHIDPINANHIDIVKPRDIRDAPYISFQNAIRDAQPAPIKTRPPHSENTKDQPASPFAFAVEVRMVSPGAGFFTGFWLEQGTLQNCSLTPIDDLVFLRITNVQAVPKTVVNYTLEHESDGKWEHLKRVNLSSGYTLLTLQPGAVPGVGKTLNFPSNGEANGYPLMSISIGNVDFKQAGVMTFPIFDVLIGGQTLTQGQTIRGWAGFQSPRMVEGSLRMELTDELGKIYSITPTVVKGGVDEDVAPHLMTIASLSDASGCTAKSDF
jgi:pimeloyl-ACP methyl ester carboxylesterase